MKLSLAVIALTLVTTRALVAAPAAPALIPQPVKMEITAGAFQLQPGTRILTDAAAQATGDYLAARLRPATGYKFQVSANAGGRAVKGNIVLTTHPAKTSLGSEGYELVVTADSVVIRAPEPAGLFYGVQTLLQLLPPEVFAAPPAKSTVWSVPCVQIEDQPRFPWRGLLVDVARHFLTVAELKKFMDVMALHKLNVLHFHLTDDQGWRLEIKKYPRLTELGSVRKESPLPGNRNKGDGTPYGPFFYTQEQIRDLVAYGQARHITLMPEIEMPGHLLGALTAYPEYSCTGGPFAVRTRWGVEPDVLCIGNPKSVALMQDILAEVIALFPSKFIHIGGDEVPRYRWQECPKCQALMKAAGLTREAQLQTWFNRHIETFLAGKGRRMIGWDEILEGGLTPGAAVMSWRGTEGGLEAAAAGHDVVMSPNSHLYLDASQATGPGEPETFGGLLPLEKVYSYEPVPAELPADQRRHILGPQGNLWSEFLWTLKRFEYNAYPRAAALAEVAWSPAAARNYDDFCRRLRGHLPRLAARQVNYRPEIAVKIGEWSPGQIPTNGVTLEWDVTRFVTAPGPVTVRLDYAGGKHGMDIAWVGLRADGKEVGRDAHAGVAGQQAQNPTYTIAAPAPLPGVRYTLAARVAGSGGTDSTGIVQLQLNPPAEQP